MNTDKRLERFPTILTCYTGLILALPGCVPDDRNTSNWVVDTTREWKQAEKESEGLGYENGFATPAGVHSRYLSITHAYDYKRTAKSIVISQSPVWHNWEQVDKVSPDNLWDAPVFLTLGQSDYWIFGMYDPAFKNGFIADEVQLDGFDVPLMTTPDPNQFDAPGGLKPSLGGYHAWQSRDMVNWVHYGPVTEQFSRWVTSAEHADGKTYLFYDYPNDQDPHLYIDEDLTDGSPGRNMGIVFPDPSHGSDSAFVRDPDGNFHVIYEDWSPIDASIHSWDSPLAGHAVSENATGNYRILPPAVDHRTNPTSEVNEYLHPNWTQHPDWDSNVGIYNVHEPTQDAFGDWAAISIGGQYYLFSDYHPVDDHIRIGWFTSSSLGEPFQFCGEIGSGHPDPDIGFAEGRFYLINQTAYDYISPGPWVRKVEARVGVDTDNDGDIDVWTDWQELSERYDYIEGFSKQIDRIPASIDLSHLPTGFGFAFEVITEDVTANNSTPILDSVTISFD